MNLITHRSYNKILTGSFDDHFDLEKDGSYLFEITASAKSWWQNTFRRIFFNKDSMTVRINAKEIYTPPHDKKLRANDLWNGNVLNGTDQTVYFISQLKRGDSSISFSVHGAPILKEIRVYLIQDSTVTVQNLLSQKRDRIPWLVFLAAEEIFFDSVLITAKAKVSDSDDDDIQLIIDRKKQKDQNNTTHKDWYWCGYSLRGSSKTFKKEFENNTHSSRIDIIADGSPTIEVLSLVFSKTSKTVMGRIALYQDIEQTDFVHLREGPRTKDREIAKLKNGEVVEIIDERVIGEWIPSRSYVWHKVRWNGQNGYIHSSFVEIHGQERSAVVTLIKKQSKELNIDQDVVLALAGCESLYKSYATSRDFEDKDNNGDPIAAKGIFQLTKPAIQQVQKNTGKYHYVINDVFDVTQNVLTGMRYVAWLYDTFYKGTPQATEKLIAAYNAGQGYIPTKGKLTYDHIPSQSKREEAHRHVSCFLEKKKKRPWKILAMIIVFILVLPFYVQGNTAYQEYEHSKPIVSEHEALLSSSYSFPTVVADEEGKWIYFFDSRKEEVKHFLLSRLRLNELTEVPIEQRDDQLIHIGPDVIEHPSHVFIFSIATSWTCGVSNCGWIIFRYNADNDALVIVAKDILASSLNFYLSPRGSQTAILSQFSAGSCNSGAYLDIMDLQTANLKPVTGFEDSSYTASSIQLLKWNNESELEFTINHSCSSPKNRGSRERVLRYHTNTNKLDGIQERWRLPGG